MMKIRIIYYILIHYNWKARPLAIKAALAATWEVEGLPWEAIVQVRIPHQKANGARFSVTPAGWIRVRINLVIVQSIVDSKIGRMAGVESWIAHRPLATNIRHGLGKVVRLVYISRLASRVVQKVGADLHCAQIARRRIGNGSCIDARTPTLCNSALVQGLRNFSQILGVFRRRNCNRGGYDRRCTAIWWCRCWRLRADDILLVIANLLALQTLLQVRLIGAENTDQWEQEDSRSVNVSHR